MRTVFRTCLLLIMVVAPLRGQAPTSVHNGFWWLDESDTFRLAYITGFADGAGEGHFWFGVAKGIKGNLITKPSYDYVRAQLDYTEIRFGQFKDGLDDFYKDYKNKSIHVDDAFGYVRDSIRGVDQNKLAHDLETLRKLAVSPSYDSNN